MLGLVQNVEAFEWVKPKLKPEQLVYIGLRDVDEAEKQILKQHKIKAFSMFEIGKFALLICRQVWYQPGGRDGAGPCKSQQK